MAPGNDQRFEEATSFFRMLADGAPSTTLLAVSAKLPTENWVHSFVPVGEPERAAKWALNFCDRQQANVYARCSVLSGKPKRGGRGKSEDTAGATVLWLDLDDPSDAALKRLEDFDPQPAAIHHSGHGFHVFWKLDAFTDDRIAVERANLGLIEAVGLAAADRCWDISRILRVPGTMNFKDVDPLPVTVKLRSDTSTPLASFPVGERKVVEMLTEGPASLPHDFLVELPVWLAARITTGEGAATKSDGSVDRSANDWSVVSHLLKRGVPPAQCISVLLHPEWVTGSKARSGGGEHYAKATVSKALVSGVPSVSVIITKEAYHWMGADFMASRFEMPGWLVDRTWLAETIGFLAGPPKVKKTWLALDLALSVATGSPFLGEFEVPDSGVVILVQREDPAVYLQDRLWKITVAKGYAPGADSVPKLSGRKLKIELPRDFPPLHIYTDPDFQLANEDAFARFQEWVESICQPKDIRLVVMDPLLKIASGFDEYRASEVMDKVFRPLDAMRRRWKTACVVVHHESKRSESSSGGQRMYGSIALHAFAESALYVSYQGPDSVLITPEYKSAAAPPMIVSFGNLEREYAAQIEKVKVTVQTISDYLIQLGQTVTAEELAKQFGMTAPAMRKLLLEGVKHAGTVIQFPGARRLGEADRYAAAPKEEDE